LAALARRQLTAHELSERLRAKGFDEQVRADVVERMVDAGLVDDVRYAEAFVRARLGRGHGPRRIMNDMRVRGIDTEIATTALGSVAGDDDFTSACIELAGRKAGGRPIEDSAARGKLMRYLAGRGFSTAQIDAAIRALNAR
jgi:regulatory protein